MATLDMTTTSRDCSDVSSEEERLRKRVYFRERKRILRIKQKSDRRDLEAAIMELNAQLHVIQQRCRATRQPSASSLLQWKDVALALQAGRNDSIADHRKLNRLVFLTKSTLEDMKRWVEASNDPVGISLDPCRDSWRHSTLLAPRDTRELGKQWIALQMYHNTAAMFSKFSFPPHPNDLHDAAFELSAEESAGGLQYVRRWQAGFPQDMTTIFRVFRDHFPSICLLDEMHPVSASSTLREASASSRLHQLVTHHPRQEWVNVMTGDFESDDRCVFVARQIQQDDLVAHAERPQRNMLFWLELVRVPDGGCRMRFLWIMSHRLNRDGSFVPFEEEAREGWGCNLDDVPVDQREAVFRQRGAARAALLQHEVERRLRSHIRSAETAFDALDTHDHPDYWR